MNLDLFAPENVDDPYPLYAHLRATSPVHQVPGTSCHLVTSWDLVREAAGRTEDFSSNLRGIMVRGADGRPERFGLDLDGTLEQVLATADGEVHKAHRKLVAVTLAQQVRALESRMDELAASCWDAGTAADRLDWVRMMADRLPPVVLGHLLGIPEDDIPRLLRWAYESVEMLGGLVPPERLEQLLVSTSELYSYLEAALVAARPDPGAGLIGALKASGLEAGTAVLILLQVVGAGAETTAGLIGTAARLLAEHPDLQRLLRAEPERTDAFLDECLRLEAPLRGHYRVVARDTELGGTELAEGSHLLLLWSSANRDPSQYPDPDALLLDRPGARVHLSFGKGAHFCVGSLLARLEATSALRVLLQRTSSVALEEASWVPSAVVRRHARLVLACQ